MDNVRTFPSQYVYLNTNVKEIDVTSNLDEIAGSADVFITLNTGEEYAFLVFTLADIQERMKDSNSKSWIPRGNIIVSELGLEPIMEGLEKILALVQDGDIPIDKFGALQKD